MEQIHGHKIATRASIGLPVVRSASIRIGAQREK